MFTYTAQCLFGADSKPLEPSLDEVYILYRYNVYNMIVHSMTYSVQHSTLVLSSCSVSLLTTSAPQLKPAAMCVVLGLKQRMKELVMAMPSHMFHIEGSSIFLSLPHPPILPLLHLFLPPSVPHSFLPSPSFPPSLPPFVSSPQDWS